MSDVEVIWSVTNRDYSEGGIACLFQTEELAKQYADALNRVDYNDTLEYTRNAQRRAGRDPEPPKPYEEWLAEGYRRYKVEPYQLWSVVPVAGGHDMLGRRDD